MILYLLIFVLGVICGKRWSRSRAVPPIVRPSVRDITDDEVEELLKSGDKLAAIRRYRELHRCDIATAQTRVELLEAMLRR